MFVNTTSERVGFFSNQYLGPAPYPGVIGSQASDDCLCLRTHAPAVKKKTKA